MQSARHPDRTRCVPVSGPRRCARVAAWLSVLLAASAGAAGATPLDYFLHTAGPAAAPTMRLGWALTALVVAVVIIVTVLLAIAIVKPRPTGFALDAVLPERGGMRWVYIGTTLSSVALMAALIYSLVVLETVAAPERRPELTIVVTAYDWWWKVEYPDDGPTSAPVVVTANEIHIPVGEPVRIALRSADVVHAFWVPQLAGKTQTIPGQTNEQWIEADRVGVYRGQCTQFCGVQHAHMAFEVVAQRPEAFAAWRAAQAQPAAATPDADAAAGKRLFAARCAGCHSVRGTPADGMQAPDLTHLGTRRLLAAGTLTNTPGHQLDWIQHAQEIKPDSLMPSIPLSVTDAAVLSAYLATLR
ncbi:cytochrome c oxidase subunit II (plasmid) [Paraburkholderia acidicola]|uniref:Cytochrome aa3 subunit 2 n=1 Tax=Paraburkholderia acidicola TaxID=1912599 RepID=A0ABV1M0K2_9BURK